MSVFKCKMCGGTIEFEAGATVGVCDSCGTRQTLPRLDDDKKSNLYDRANHFRRNNDFDKAMGIYEQILNEDSTDAEAYWSLVLCRYGIEYVEDPSTHKRIPTVNRAQFTSVYMDEDYKSALQYADGYQRQIYEAEAKAIDDIQKGILEISNKEKPFDIFICYKESDASGRRTPDSVLATELYHELTKEGFKVFFSRITLEDKLGVAYEPYIFAALNSSKVMVVLGTKPEYFNAVWVKNEWSRYLALIKNGAKKMLIPAYRDMDPYDLPEEFSHLQAQDMSKLGFMQDLIRGIEKIISPEAPKETVKETVVVQSTGNANTATLLERVFLFLEDGKWQDANIYCEKVLDIDPKNAEAYLGKLMAELKVKTRKQLADCAEPFDSSDNYSKIIRFGDEKLETEVRGYVDYIKERNKNKRLEGVYSRAISAINTAHCEKAYKDAADIFKTIIGYKDSDVRVEQCLEKAEICRKDAIYVNAENAIKSTTDKKRGYRLAIESFKSISGWKDADERIISCQKAIEEIEAKEEERRIAEEKAAKKRKKFFMIATPIVCVIIAFIILLNTIIIPSIKYNVAVSLYEKGEYEKAIAAFEALDGYKDSTIQINDAKYDAAVALYNECKYTEAITAFEALDGYKDSATQIENCNTGILNDKYDAAVALYNEGKYEEAISAFEALDGFKDSKTQIENCNTGILDDKYDVAVALYNEGKYEEAISAFEALDGYKDSATQIENCNIGILDDKYDAAIALYNEGEVIEAYESLIALNGYKDSDQNASEMYDQYKIEKIKVADVGDIVFLGAYEQDNNISNGKENIEWLVLAKEGNKILVISDKALDCQLYNTTYTSATWETCTLRTWLNNTFLNTAFSTEEQSQILSTTVSADKNPNYSTNPGNATTDKVFLLSITEAEKYFSSDEDRKCIPTEYARAQSVYTSKGGEATCWWWLRSPGFFQNYASSVYRDGSVHCSGNSVDYVDDCVRPALWINLES